MNNSEEKNQDFVSADISGEIGGLDSVSKANKRNESINISLSGRSQSGSSKRESGLSVLCEQINCPNDVRRELASSDSEQSTSSKCTNREFKSHLSRDEQNFCTIVQMAELAIELKDKSSSGDKYVAYLRSLIFRATKTVMGLKNTSRNLLVLVLKLILVAQKQMLTSKDAETSTPGLKQHYQKIISIMEREILEVDDLDAAEFQFQRDLQTTSLRSVIDKIKQMEDRRPKSPMSLKSYRHDVNERYPESVSRDSLLDLENIGNLPTVPEGMPIHTGYVIPQRSSSMSALRNIRKVKLSLQKVENAEFESEESEVGVKEYTSDSDYESSGTYKRQISVQTNLKNISEESPEDHSLAT